MTTLSASLRLRPTRIGFLVDPDDAEALRRVFQVCTCLWGGTFNPVIPVCSAIPTSWQNNPFPTPSPADLARGYVNFFDVFVETKEGLAASIPLQQSKLDFHRPRIVPLNAFFEANEQQRSGVPFAKFVEPAIVCLDNLWTLAEFTQQLYLGLPDSYSHLRAPAPAQAAGAPT